jgi:hypothetical protein
MDKNLLSKLPRISSATREDGELAFLHLDLTLFDTRVSVAHVFMLDELDQRHIVCRAVGLRLRQLADAVETQGGTAALDFEIEPAAKRAI